MKMQNTCAEYLVGCLLKYDRGKNPKVKYFRTFRDWECSSIYAHRMFTWLIVELNNVVSTVQGNSQIPTLIIAQWRILILKTHIRQN